MIRITEKQLQAVLDAHQEGKLIPFGSDENGGEDRCNGRGCLVELALGAWNGCDEETEKLVQGTPNSMLDIERTRRDFDRYYEDLDDRLTRDELRAALLDQKLITIIPE